MRFLQTFGLLTALFSYGTAPAQQTVADEPSATVDYLSFGNGTVPIDISGTATSIGSHYEHALQAIDGNADGYSLARKPAGHDADFIFTYALPAATTFNHFEIPNVLETPSPSQTFIRQVEVYGSSQSANDGYKLLAKTELQTHPKKGQRTRFKVTTLQPVQWLQLRLAGGIDVQKEKMFYEFSEIAGYGTQASVPRSDRFNGAWKGRGVNIQLQQEAATVSGCYDKRGVLKGTVTGNLLHATGKNLDDKTLSSFVLNVSEDGVLRGVRSSNGGPFRLYTAAQDNSGKAHQCQETTNPTLSCGAIIHGIQFAFDSDQLLPESAPILSALFDGLKQTSATHVTIEGHSSSEGTEAYNLALSKRRAEAVVSWLSNKGIAAKRLAAAGIGEARPLASNKDEAGRSINRRVEIHCAESS